MILPKETVLETPLPGNTLSNDLLVSYDNAQPSSATTRTFGITGNPLEVIFYFP